MTRWSRSSSLSTCAMRCAAQVRPANSTPWHGAGTVFAGGSPFPTRPLTKPRWFAGFRSTFASADWRTKCTRLGEVHMTNDRRPDPEDPGPLSPTEPAEGGAETIEESIRIHEEKDD